MEGLAKIVISEFLHLFQVSLEMKKESASAVILQPNNQGDTSDPSDKKKPKVPAKFFIEN